MARTLRRHRPIRSARHTPGLYALVVSTALGTVPRRVASHVHDRVEGWRTGSRASQVYVLCVLLGVSGVSLVASWVAHGLVPFTVWFVWLLLGVLLLRTLPLLLLSGVVLAAASATTLHHGLDGRSLTTLLTLVVSVGLVVYQSSRQRSGLPVALSEAMLAQLRDRLQRQGVVPPLPHPWRAESAMLSAHGTGYAGDFLVADLREDRHARDGAGGRVRQGRRGRSAGAPVRRRAGRAARGAAAGRADAGGQRVPAAAGLGGVLRHRRARARRPGHGGLHDHQRRAPAGAALAPRSRRVGRRQRARHRARRGARPGAARQRGAARRRGRR